jgi:hypothetical protein
MVKTEILTMLVRSDDGGVDALIPFRRHRFGESGSEFRCFHHSWCYTGVKLYLLWRGLYFLYFYLFWLCVSLIYRLDLDIILLQRPGVIGIILILIYFLYKKKITQPPRPGNGPKPSLTLNLI